MGGREEARGVFGEEGVEGRKFGENFLISGNAFVQRTGSAATRSSGVLSLDHEPQPDPTESRYQHEHNYLHGLTISSPSVGRILHHRRGEYAGATIRP